MITSERILPYDPTNSPGPIPSILKHFKHRPNMFEWCANCADDPQVFTVVLMAPEHTEALGFERDETGFVVYRGIEYCGRVAHLREAVELIEQEIGHEVCLVEHQADLPYWTGVPASSVKWDELPKKTTKRRRGSME